MLYIDPFGTVNYERFFLSKSKDRETLLIVTWRAMDLTINDQHRMIELSKFHFFQDTIDNIMLVPAIMERLHQQSLSSLTCCICLVSESVSCKLSISAINKSHLAFLQCTSIFCKIKRVIFHNGSFPLTSSFMPRKYVAV